MLCERPSMRTPRRRRPPPAQVCALAAPATLLPAASAPFCVNASLPKRTQARASSSGAVVAPCVR
eukprot:2337929-Prymnesium_polylepis.1